MAGLILMVISIFLVASSIFMEVQVIPIGLIRLTPLLLCLVVPSILRMLELLFIIPTVLLLHTILPAVQYVQLEV
jgi:hypothetical protein